MSCLMPPYRVVAGMDLRDDAAPSFRSSVGAACCQSNGRSLNGSSLSRPIVGPRLVLLGCDVVAGRPQALISALSQAPTGAGVQ